MKKEKKTVFLFDDFSVRFDEEAEEAGTKSNAYCKVENV
jgi:hypothetical protein